MVFILTRSSATRDVSLFNFTYGSYLTMRRHILSLSRDKKRFSRFWNAKIGERDKAKDVSAEDFICEFLNFTRSISLSTSLMSQTAYSEYFHYSIACRNASIHLDSLFLARM